MFDIENHGQRTKLDVFDDALFLVVKLIYPDRVTEKTRIEQISFYLKENILITFQEKPSDVFDQVKSKWINQRMPIYRLYVLQYVSRLQMISGRIVAVFVVGKSTICCTCC
jgi:Mg2+ and Co2+ transporter CorA